MHAATTTLPCQLPTWLAELEIKHQRAVHNSHLRLAGVRLTASRWVCHARRMRTAHVGGAGKRSKVQASSLCHKSEFGIEVLQYAKACGVDEKNRKRKTIRDRYSNSGSAGVSVEEM